MHKNFKHKGYRLHEWKSQFQKHGVDLSCNKLFYLVKNGYDLLSIPKMPKEEFAKVIGGYSKSKV